MIYVEKLVEIGEDAATARSYDNVFVQGCKLPPAERKARTLIFTQHEMAVFITGAKNGDFDHLLD